MPQTPYHLDLAQPRRHEVSSPVLFVTAFAQALRGFTAAVFPGLLAHRSEMRRASEPVRPASITSKQSLQRVVGAMPVSMADPSTS